jgi:hypothetical protein
MSNGHADCSSIGAKMGLSTQSCRRRRRHSGIGPAGKSSERQTVFVTVVTVSVEVTTVGHITYSLIYFYISCIQ